MESGNVVSGICPAAQSFFADFSQAQCASNNCCPEYTACEMSADCLVVATCFSQCQMAGAATDDACRMQCQVDASATGSADFGTAFACYQANCAPFGSGGGNDAGSD
jgi:hypothetical protein